MRALLFLTALGLVMHAHAEVVVLSDGTQAIDAERGIAELTRAIKAKDARAVKKLLGDDLTSGGMWFPDAGCAKQFGKAGPIGDKAATQLARCLVKLSPQMSTRRSSARDGAVLTYAPGFEVELAFRGGQIRWLGSAQPSLTAQAFEALRTGGTTLLDEKLRTPLAGKLGGATSVSVWLETCLDTRGTVTKLSYHGAPSTEIGEAVLAAARDWTFKPFEHAGRKLPVCALSLITYPAALAPSTEVLPPSAILPYARVRDDLLESPDEPSAVAGSTKTVPASTLEKLRLAGTTYIDPDPNTRADMIAAGKLAVNARIRYCIDTSGDVVKITMVKRSGFKDYDHKLVFAIDRWRFRPYMVNNAVVDVCAIATFMVTPDPTMQNP